jgi:hypothetical protein
MHYQNKTTLFNKLGTESEISLPIYKSQQCLILHHNNTIGIANGIFDFRSDKETKLKYLALISWADEISKTQYSMHEIIDRFEYLYHDYIKSYERHKIISSFGKIEVLIGGALSFLTNNAPLALNTASSLVKFGMKAVGLLQDQSKLPGKEIAYVYHAGKRFSNL